MAYKRIREESKNSAHLLEVLVFHKEAHLPSERIGWTIESPRPAKRGPGSALDNREADLLSKATGSSLTDSNNCLFRRADIVNPLHVWPSVETYHPLFQFQGNADLRQRAVSPGYRYHNVRASYD